MIYTLILKTPQGVIEHRQNSTSAIRAIADMRLENPKLRDYPVKRILEGVVVPRPLRADLD